MRSGQLTAALFLLCAAPALAAPPFLAGSWFGTGQPGDKSEMWIAHMGADGSFRAQFRRCVQGKAFDSAQTGRWTLAGDVETIAIATVDGRPWPRRDTYHILSHTKDKQTYRYDGNGFVYTSRRVAESFEMPACDLVS